MVDLHSHPTMRARAEELIAALELIPHPEGGHFREIHRSNTLVDPRDGRPERAALTSIYFLLMPGQVSRWHRVASDEAWHFLEGDPLELFEAASDFERVSTHTLGVRGGTAEPPCVVVGGSWQVARTTGDYTLVGCTVGPGFDFADLVMLHDLPEEARRLRQKHPQLASFV